MLKKRGMKRAAVRALAAVMVLSLAIIPLPAQAAAADSGQFGYTESIHWSYDGEGTLTLSGSGVTRYIQESDRKNYDQYKDSVTRIVVEEGITGLVGAELFSNYPLLDTVLLPEGLEAFGLGAFVRCKSLKEIKLPKSLQTISVIGWDDVVGSGTHMDLNYQGTRAQWNAVLERSGLENDNYWEELERDYYPVHCTDDPGSGNEGGSGTDEPGTDKPIPTPDNLKAVAGDEGVMLEWTIGGSELPVWEDYSADGYVIYRKAEGKDWEEIARPNRKEMYFDRAYLDRDTQPGRLYTYSAACTYGDQVGVRDSVGVTVRTPFDFGKPSLYTSSYEGVSFEEVKSYQRLPVVKPADIVLDPADPVPEVLLREEGGTVYYNGRVMLEQGQWAEGYHGKAISLETPVILDTEKAGQVVKIAVDPQALKEAGFVLQPKSAYTLRMEDSQGRELYRTYLSTEIQIWGFGNTDELRIDKQYYLDVFGDEEGKRIYKEDANHGNNGLCFGMAAAVSLVNQGSLSPEAFEGKRLQDIHALTEAVDPQTGYETVQKLIMKLQIRQNDEQIREQISSHRSDYSGMVRAIDQGKMPVLYLYDSIGTDQAGESYIHAVTAYDYSVSGEDLTLYTYDPSGVGFYNPITVSDYRDPVNAVWDYYGHGADGKDTRVYLSWIEVTKEFLQQAGSQGSASAVSFSDVPENAWYADAVAWAVANGVTNGTSDTEFSPDRTCTRGQLVTFLWRAAGEPEAEEADPGFIDVGDEYYTPAVAWAVEEGITTGVGEGRFAPNQVCTRAQVVTFLHRFAGDPGNEGDSAFRDVPADSWYSEAVSWAVENDITQGTGNGLFSPDAGCTRAQIVTFLYRFME